VTGPIVVADFDATGCRGIACGVDNRFVNDVNELVDPALSSDERFLLRCRLVEWAGPARCTDPMAAAMGFGSVRELFRESDRLIDAIEQGRPLSRWDWSRCLIATEIVFVSNVMGSGHDWSITTGLDDATTLVRLRELQLKLSPVVVPIGPRVMGETR
jgi:hypothetical protein